MFHSGVKDTLDLIMVWMCCAAGCSISPRRIQSISMSSSVMVELIGSERILTELTPRRRGGRVAEGNGLLTPYVVLAFSTTSAQALDHKANDEWTGTDGGLRSGPE